MTVLHEPGEPIKFGYFLNSGMASVLTVLTEGKSVEVGLTGKDGFVGLPLIVGFSTSPTQAVIQIEATVSGSTPRNLVQVVRQCPGLAEPAATLCADSGYAGNPGGGLQSAA